MPNRSKLRVLALMAPVALPALLLGGCAGSSTVLSSANPSRSPAADWSDYDALPVAVRGVVPGHSKADLAALFPAYHAPQYASLGGGGVADRHMVLYVNPANALSIDNLCNGNAGFHRGVQQGETAYVVGALCDGGTVISRATARVRASDDSSPELAYNFKIIRDQLYQSLYPGANDPDRYYEGYP